MRKLNYNIYNNITDEDYFAVQDKLTLIESEMEQLFENTEWHLSTPVIKSDGLGIDFLITESIFRGNLGMQFEDAPGAITFNFYVTKSFDENGQRYFLRFYIFQNKAFDFFENSIPKFVNEATAKYNSWSKNDIVALGITVELRH